MPTVVLAGSNESISWSSGLMRRGIARSPAKEISLFHGRRRPGVLQPSYYFIFLGPYKAEPFFHKF